MINGPHPPESTPISYQTAPRPGEPVLVVLNADGYVEVYAERHIDVHIATRPDTTSAEGEQLADEYMELCLPTRYREIYWPINLRATEMIRTITPEDIAWHEWQLEMLQSISNAGRILRSDDGKEDQQIWIL